MSERGNEVSGSLDKVDEFNDVDGSRARCRLEYMGELRDVTCFLLNRKSSPQAHETRT